MLTSSSSYYGGQAYTQKIIGYGSQALPTGTEAIIPSAQGALTGTYETSDTYDPDTAALSSYHDFAAGALPAEIVNIGYDTAGDPVSLGSSIWSYVTSLSYTHYGQPLEYKLGPSSSEVDVTDSYDQQTQRLAGSQVVTVSNGATVDATGYTYDNVGNVLSESDTPSGGPSQVQCFQYDYLGRLSQAWSQGTTGCASTPSQPNEGGAAPYWGSYNYNGENDLTSQASTPRQARRPPPRTATRRPGRPSRTRSRPSRCPGPGPPATVTTRPATSPRPPARPSLSPYRGMTPDACRRSPPPRPGPAPRPRRVTCTTPTAACCSRKTPAAPCCTWATSRSCSTPRPTRSAEPATTRSAG